MIDLRLTPLLHRQHALFPNLLLLQNFDLFLQFAVQRSHANVLRFRAFQHRFQALIGFSQRRDLRRRFLQPLQFAFGLLGFLFEQRVQLQTAFIALRQLGVFALQSAQTTANRAQLLVTPRDFRLQLRQRSQLRPLLLTTSKSGNVETWWRAVRRAAVEASQFRCESQKNAFEAEPEAG